MEHLAHSDWMFEHFLNHHLNHSADIHSGSSTDTSQVTAPPTNLTAKTLWHHLDGPSSSSVTQGSAASNVNGPTAAPTLTITNHALTVNAGGSTSLPISVSPTNGQTSVTISGLTNYETVTDSLDGKTFTADANGSIIVSAAEVDSGLSLASNYTGTDHPVNSLTVTASETIGHHTLISPAQTITVTDPPASTSGSRNNNPLTLQVSGDQYNGDPQIEVFVDGKQIGSTYTVTADHAAGQTQTITITGHFDPTVAHQVQVRFLNDAWDGTSWWSNGSGADGHDRNVYVDSISLNDQTLIGSQGTDAATNGAVPAANANEAVMDVNGTLAFNVPAAGTTSTSTSTSTSSTSTSSTSTSSTSTSSTGSTSTSTGSTSTSTSSTSGRDWAFFANEGTSTANWTSVNSGWSSQPIDGLSAFTDIGDGYFAGTAQQWSPKPQAVMMNVQYGTPGTNDIDMGQAALGTYDATWLSWLKADATQAAANGTPVTVVRIWQEINGDWEPWSINQTGATSVDGTAPGSPWSAATIIAAWNHMAAQVHAAFPNAKIEWNLSAGGPWSGPSGAGNGSGFDLYPGDQYVNVIGLDAYEKSTSWANTVSGPGVNLNNLVAFASAHGKEVAVSETATTNNDGSYLTSMTNYFDALGKEAAYISYYDQGTANNGGDIIYSSSGPDSAPADRVALNESSFGTKPYIGTL